MYEKRTYVINKYIERNLLNIAKRCTQLVNECIDFQIFELSQNLKNDVNAEYRTSRFPAESSRDRER